MSTVTDTAGWLTDGANWTGGDGILARLGEHLMLSGASIGIAAALALPVGVLLGHLGRGGTLAINISNIGRAVPTFAVLVLLAIGPLGIGDSTTIVALTLFAIAPLVTNSYVGVREVDTDIRDAARGMGMSHTQLLRRVELPLAVPMIMVGIRLAAVQVIATATIAALIGGGGLGRLVVDGLAQRDQPKVVGGAVLVAVLALAVDGLLLLLQKLASPSAGWRGAPSPAASLAATSATAASAATSATSSATSSAAPSASTDTRGPLDGGPRTP